MKKILKSFQKEKQLMASIPISQRPAFNLKILQIPQNPNPPPLLYYQSYPNQSTFFYNGYALNYYFIENTPKPKAILIIFHGFNMHAGHTGYFASKLAINIKQLNVFAVDQMNFGKSQGPFRGQITSLANSVEESQSFVDFLLQRMSQKPKIFLAGASYGGSIAFKMGLNRPQMYSGVIFLSPALRNLNESIPYSKIFAKILGWIMPRLRTFPQNYLDNTKYNMQLIAKQDKLRYNDGMVPGSIRGILYAMQQVSKQYDAFQCPYLAFQSMIQKMVDPFAVLDLQYQCLSADKTTIYVGNTWHSLFFEQSIKEIAKITEDWLIERIQ